MSDQIYKPSFGVTAKQKEFTVTSANSEPVVHTGALDVVIQGAKSIGNFAHALLMIAIVGAHPVSVALLIANVFFNQ
jgi:hypothetical protein